MTDSNDHKVTESAHAESNTSANGSKRGPSIWKELESMGEVPPENNDHLRRNFRHTRRRDERNNFSKAASSNAPHDNSRWRSNYDYQDHQRGSNRDYLEHNAGGSNSGGRNNRASGGGNFRNGSQFSQGFGGQYKESRFSKNSPAFRSIQSTLSQDSNSAGRSFNRGASFDANNPGGVDNRISAVGRGRGVNNVRSDPLGNDRRHNEEEHSSVDANSTNFKDNPENYEDCNDDNNQNNVDAVDDETYFSAVEQMLQNLDRSSRSARNVTNLILNVMKPYTNDCQKWQTLIDGYIIAYATEVGSIYIEFAVHLFVHFIDEPTFQKAAYIVLMRHIGQLMTPREWNREEKLQLSNLCEFFGKLLISTWPPGWDSCAKECNMIVYAIMNAAHTWLRALEKAANKKSPSRAEITEVCAESIVSLCSATGRKLWLKWPDLVDQMYSVLKPVIVCSDCGISEETKLDLLDLFVKLNEWPKPISQSHQKQLTRNESCQTDDPYTFSQWQNNLPAVQTGYNNVSIPQANVRSAGSDQPSAFQNMPTDSRTMTNLDLRSADPRIFLAAPMK